MTEEWHWALHAVALTVIGFFVRHHWVEYVDYGARITALELDKAKRETTTP